MNERVLENWLDSANERTFQIPFAHSLAAEGYEVIHVSRHCAMEMGKDILAIAPDGVPCAYQLKNVEGRQLSLSKWRDDLERQLIPLVYNQIVHPSINGNRRHRPFIVINGELSEEVSNSIDQFNKQLGRNRPQLRTIVRGELLSRFQKLGSDFWPPDISFEFKLLLELLLSVGTELLPKAKLAGLLESGLCLEDSKQVMSAAVAATKLSGLSILCSYAIEPFQRKNNHAAEFEAWTILLGYLFAFCEKNGVSEKAWGPVIGLVQKSMFNTLGRLFDELKGRQHLTEGDPFVDRYVKRARITHLVSLMALLRLWRRFDGILEDSQDEFIDEFVRQHIEELWLWGEGAAPQFLVSYLHQRSFRADLKSEQMLIRVIAGIIVRNRPRSEKGLASPYYDIEDVLRNELGDEERKIREKFAGSSYTVEAFLNLLVECNLKGPVRNLWPDLSRIMFAKFTPAPAWRFYQWRAKKGLTSQTQSKPTQVWSQMRAGATNYSVKTLPKLIRRFPIQYLALTLVYPHRLTTEGARWISKQIADL